MNRRRRYVYQLGEGLYLFSATVPRRLPASEADKLLRIALEVRTIGRQSASLLTPAERVVRAHKAAGEVV